ncbi:hypothetical protein [Streptomyces noursei]|uniref:hypothetical protein n=1 Tax=Streptomyces noursei TaxID=1971 RepID=UPI00381904AC
MPFTLYKSRDKFQLIPVSDSLVLGPPVTLYGKSSSFGPVKADEGRALIYCAYSGSEEAGVHEASIDGADPKIRQLKTRCDARLLSAGLAYGMDQPPHVDNRLFCGDDKGNFYTFPLSKDGKTRAETEPTPYRLVDAGNSPVIDIAVHSKGTCVYALVGRPDGSGEKALLMQEVKGPPPFALGEHPTWDVIGHPYRVTKTDDDRYIIVNGEGTTIVDVCSGTPKDVNNFSEVPLQIRGTHSVCGFMGTLGGEGPRLKILDLTQGKVVQTYTLDKIGIRKDFFLVAQGYNEDLNPSWLVVSIDSLKDANVQVHLISMTPEVKLSVTRKEIPATRAHDLLSGDLPSLLIWGK